MNKVSAEMLEELAKRAKLTMPCDHWSMWVATVEAFEELQLRRAADAQLPAATADVAAGIRGHGTLLVARLRRCWRREGHEAPAL